MAITKQAILIGTGATVVAGGGYGAFYLSQDKTIKDRLIKKVTLASNDKEYRITFKELKNQKEFTDDISTMGVAITASSKVNDGGSALKKWCDKYLNTYLSDENSKKLTEKSIKYCVKPPLTIKEKLEKNNKQLITAWENKLTQISRETQQDSDLQSDLTQENPLVTNFTTPSAKVASEALKNWCEKNIKTELISETSEAIWTKVEKRCLEATG